MQGGTVYLIVGPQKKAGVILYSKYSVTFFIHLKPLNRSSGPSSANNASKFTSPP